MGWDGIAEIITPCLKEKRCNDFLDNGDQNNKDSSQCLLVEGNEKCVMFLGSVDAKGNVMRENRSQGTVHWALKLLLEALAFPGQSLHVRRTSQAVLYDWIAYPRRQKYKFWVILKGKA
eukprot:scaffold21696_cov47-Attheya_sp.AAC.3